MMIDSEARARKILAMAEELCFCNHQISIADANPGQLHECLAQAVVHYLSGSWNRSRQYKILRILYNRHPCSWSCNHPVSGRSLPSFRRGSQPLPWRSFLRQK